MLSHWRSRIAGAVVAAGVAWGVLAAPQNSPSAPAARGTPAVSEAGLQSLANRAAAALRAQDFSSAIGAYEKLVRAAPQDAPFRANLCLAYYSVRRYREAAAACQKARQLDPALKAPRYFLALSLAESGQCAQALPSLVQAFASASKPPMKRQLGLDGANCAMQTGDTARATDFVNLLVQKFPNDPDVLYTASHVYSDLSSRLAVRLLNAAPGSYQAHEFNAEVLAFQGKLQDAEAEYRTVLRLNPQLPGIHDRLGKLLLQAAQSNQALQEARRQFEDELRVDPENADAEYELGQMAWQDRRYEDAVERLRHAAQIQPSSPLILVALGRALVSAGKPQAALDPLKAAIKMDPNDPMAHYQLAFALLHLGRQPEADRELAIYKRIHQEALAKKQRIRQGIEGAPSGPPRKPPPL